MAPKNKFTKEEMTEAAVQVVRQKGIRRAYGPEHCGGAGNLDKAGVYLL